MFNKTTLAGNLTRDIEIKYTQGGSAIANTAIATSRKFTQNGEKKEEVCFIDITFFGRSAEVANQFLRKGSKILVDGRIKFDQWVDQNGGKRSKHSVIVETMQMLDSKPQNESNSHTNHNVNNPQNPNDNAYGGRTYQQPQQQSGPQHKAPNNVPMYDQDKEGNTRQRPPANSVPVIDIDEDEIPF